MESTAQIKPMGKVPNIYVETASLTEGEIPKEAIPVTATHPSPLQYWKEVARYVLYEEVYDDEAEVFDNAQCPAVPHHVLEKLLSILRDELEVVRSDSYEYEDLVADIVAHAKLRKYITTDRHVKKMESTLLASRWHPDISPSQNRTMTALRRRVSISLKTEEDNELTNKTLTKCLSRNCEACSIMIGQVSYLKKDLYLLVQVAANPPPKLTGLVEVDVGTRFIFLALTHKLSDQSFLFQLSRCLASILGDPRFLKCLYQSQKNEEFFKAALKSRKEMNVISTRYGDIVNKTGGIELPQTNLTEVQFDRRDLVFDVGSDDLEEEKVADFDVTVQEDKLLHCTPRAFKRFCPPFKELCQGLVELAKRMPGDYIDAFKKKNIGTVLSSILFIYFVVFAPSITFGTLMLNEVNQSYNISLNILATGVITVVFVLLAGQPLSSIGPSGPNFIIETVIAMLATKMKTDYQVFRFWIGIYIAAFGVLLISLNLSSLVIYARRSLEELFSGFISLFLILKALFSMFKVIPQNIPQPEKPEDLIKASRAAVHLFLAFCMLTFSIFINKLKGSHYFRRKMRYWLGAFNVPLGIIFVSIMAALFFSSYPVVKLNIPPAVHADPSSWVNVIDFAKINNYQSASPVTIHISAFIIGGLTSLLIFTEIALNSITALKPKAKKPSPFVIDHVLTVVVFPLTCCIVGWPFMSGVPVRTIANTMALVQVDPHPPPGKPAE
ncbi:unnamed protein product [Hymenolepis diminuta]|nr:unnamed protein product [Hymenolepis diminuta]